MVEIADLADMLNSLEAPFDCGLPVRDDLEHFVDRPPHTRAAYGKSVFTHCGFYFFKRRSCRDG